MNSLRIHEKGISVCDLRQFYASDFFLNPGQKGSSPPKLGVAYKNTVENRVMPSADLNRKNPQYSI